MIARHYYNENDPFCVAWLRELMKAQQIPDGEIDARSIELVQPDDLRGFVQCHFFAGIGGWPYALRLAGWPEGRECWTGSCPCQPLSCAGQRQGHVDRRHLWPSFYRLIAERRPSIVFGEQVASADGREWLAGIRADLEDVGYACGAADLCAAGVQSPQVRQRLYWMANGDGYGCNPSDLPVRSRRQDEAANVTDGQVATLRVSNATEQRSWAAQSRDGSKEADYRWPHDAPPNRRFTDGFGNSYRIPESGIPFLADGVPGILDRISACGNAIVPQVAQVFIEAYLELAREDGSPRP